MEVELLIFVIYPSISHLKENIDDDDEERVGEVEEEPDLHRLDVGGAGETGGHREVDGGQHHKRGDVQLENEGVLVLPRQVYGGLGRLQSRPRSSFIIISSSIIGFRC